MFIWLSILTSFKIHYLYFSCVGTWHYAPSYSLILLCRYVTLWSPTTMCLNVTLRSPKSTCRFVTPDPLISFYQFIKPSLIPRHHQSHYFCSSSLLLYQGIVINKYIRVFQDLGFNSFIMLILSQLYNHIHASIQLSM